MPSTARTTARFRRIAAVGGGLLGVAALAGCAPTASGSAQDAGAAPAPASASASASGAPASGGASAVGGSLKDGTYRATGDYQSPGGPSRIGVTVTLKGGDIARVEVEPEAENGTARQYESQFASGIGAVAVGKPISDLQVGAVSGSSLTSQGFEKALRTIEQQAAA